MTKPTGQDHESNDLYKSLFNYARGFDVDAELFAGSLAQFLRKRFWEGWYDEASNRHRKAASVEKFFSAPCPEGIGKSLPWVCGALETARKLGHESAGEALALLEQALEEAGEPGPKAQVKREVVRQTKPIAPHRRPTKEEAANKGSDRTFKRGETTEYLTARLKRDAPEIAERLERGEFKSVRQAAKAARIVKEQTPLDQLRKLWAKASEEDRKAFLAEIVPRPENC